MPVDVAAYIYSALIAAGGIMGYVKAGSTASLISGLAFGGAAGFGAYLSSQDPRNLYVLLGTSGVLAGLMGYRFANSGKFMPPGLVALLSFLMVGRCVYRLMNA